MAEESGERRKPYVNTVKIVKNNGNAGFIYGLGFIGALIHYLQHAATFWIGVMGIVKALVWPAILVYKLFEFLK